MKATEETPREQELRAAANEMFNEATAIYMDRLRVMSQTLVGRCFALPITVGRYGSGGNGSPYWELSRPMHHDNFRNFPEKENARRYLRVVSVGSKDPEEKWPHVSFTGFDVIDKPASFLMPLGKWTELQADLDGWQELTRAEYHKAWMDAVEALELP